MNPDRSRASLWAAGSALTLLVVAARPGPGPAIARSQVPVTAPSTPQSTDTLRVGCSGGVMALGTGNLLTRGGALMSYQKELQAPYKYEFIRRDSAAAALVFSELEKIPFRTLRSEGPDNMTCVLELKARTGEYEVTWIMGRPQAALKPVLAALKRTFGGDRDWGR